MRSIAMEMLVTVFAYVLLAACYLGTIAAPSVQRHLVNTASHSPSTILVAGSEDGNRDSEDDGHEDGGGSHGDHASRHGIVTSEEDECGERLQSQMDDCLEGFEVQLVTYEDPGQSESQRWQALRELCRRHDQTLQCIYTAFIYCQPTSMELQLMTYRIGYLRDYMLRECPVARAMTTTTMATTTTTKIWSPVWPTTSPSNVFIFVENSQDSDNVESQNDRGYVFESDRGSAPPSGRDKNQNIAHEIDLHHLSNDSHSELSEGHSGMENSAIWCLKKEGESQEECLLRFLKSSTVVLETSLLRQTFVSCMLLTYHYFI